MSVRIPARMRVAGSESRPWDFGGRRQRGGSGPGPRGGRRGPHAPEDERIILGRGGRVPWAWSGFQPGNIHEFSCRRSNFQKRRRTPGGYSGSGWKRWYGYSGFWTNGIKKWWGFRKRSHGGRVIRSIDGLNRDFNTAPSIRCHRHDGMRKRSSTVFGGLPSL